LAPQGTPVPKGTKQFYKNRWLLFAAFVIALRRAGVLCDIVVQDHTGNSVALPTEDLLHLGNPILLAGGAASRSIRH
jgi:hypothetical protein